MTRADLEHVLRAAVAITGDDDIVVVGSSAILGQFPDLPPELRESKDADIYPLNHPERAELIEAIGEMSPFDETFGYHAEGVAADLARLPAGWKERLIPVPVDGGRGLCLEVHDLVLSKYAAFREKDRDFVRAVVALALVERDVLLDRLTRMELETSARDLVREQVRADFDRARDSSS